MITCGCRVPTFLVVCLILACGFSGLHAQELTVSVVPMPTSAYVPQHVRGASALVLSDGSLLVVGGRDEDGLATRFAARYDASDSPDPILPEPWGRRMAVLQLARARAWASCVRLKDGRVLVAGGRGLDGAMTGSIELFDPEHNVFTTLGDLAHPRAKHDMVELADGRVLVTGGKGDAGPVDQIEAVDVAAATVTPVKRAPVLPELPPFTPLFVTVDDKILSVDAASGAVVPAPDDALPSGDEPSALVRRTLASCGDGAAGPLALWLAARARRDAGDSAVIESIVAASANLPAVASTVAPLRDALEAAIATCVARLEVRPALTWLVKLSSIGGLDVNALKRRAAALLPALATEVAEAAGSAGKLSALVKELTALRRRQPQAAPAVELLLRPVLVACRGVLSAGHLRVAAGPDGLTDEESAFVVAEDAVGPVASGVVLVGGLTEVGLGIPVEVVVETAGGEPWSGPVEAPELPEWFGSWSEDGMIVPTSTGAVLLELDMGTARGRCWVSAVEQGSLPIQELQLAEVGGASEVTDPSAEVSYDPSVDAVDPTMYATDAAVTDPYAAGTDPYAAATGIYDAGTTDPYAAAGTDPYATDPYAAGTDPYAAGTDPYAAGTDPYAAGTDPYAAGTDPYATGETPTEYGETPAESGGVTEEYGETPAESGEVTEEYGEVPGESGETTEPSGEVPGESGETTEPSGEVPGESGETTVPSGEVPTVIPGGTSITVKEPAVVLVSAQDPSLTVKKASEALAKSDVTALKGLFDPEAWEYFGPLYTANPTVLPELGKLLATARPARPLAKVAAGSVVTSTVTGVVDGTTVKATVCFVLGTDGVWRIVSL